MLTRQAGGYLEKKKKEMGEKRDCARVPLITFNQQDKFVWKT